MSGWGINDLEPANVKKTMSDYAKSLKTGLDFKNFHRDSSAALIKKIAEFVELKKTEMLLAWWSEYGFNPGEAVLVHGYDNEGQCIVGIRAHTPEEAEMFRRATLPAETLEKLVSDMYKKWVPEIKTEMQEGRHGSDKGEIHEVTFYFDETKGEWTLKEFAFEGHLRKVLQPIIQNVMKSDSEAKE